MPPKRITPTFLGAVPAQPAPPLGQKKKKKKKKGSTQERYQRALLRVKKDNSAKNVARAARLRRKLLDKQLGSYGPAPSIPDSAFAANRAKGSRKFTTEEQVLKHYAKKEAHQPKPPVKKTQTKPKCSKEKPTATKGTCPLGPPPTNKSCVRGHWRKKGTKK